MDLHLVAHRLWQASAAFEVAVLGRLLFSGLLRRYKWLAILLAYDAAKTVVLSNLHFASSLEYAQFYVVAHAPLCVLQCATVAELFDLVIEAYPRIGRTATLLFRASVSIALLISVIIASLTQNPRFPFWLTAALDVEKAVVIGCTLLICCQAAFFFLIRVPMRTNLVRHRFVLTMWWLASGASLISVMPYFSAFGDLRNVTFFTLTNACYIAWALLLREAGEGEPDRGSPLNNEEVAQALQAYKISQAVQEELRGLGSDQGNAIGFESQ